MPHVSIGVRTALMVFYGYMCQYCGSAYGTHLLTIDHIDPVSRGGKNALENYTLACAACNQRKSNYLLPEPIRKKRLEIAAKNAVPIVELHQELTKKCPALLVKVRRRNYYIALFGA